LSVDLRQLTRTGRMPEAMRASIGGFRSLDNNFLAALKNNDGKISKKENYIVMLNKNE